jgi:hypothetical protein
VAGKKTTKTKKIGADMKKKIARAKAAQEAHKKRVAKKTKASDDDE